MAINIIKEKCIGCSLCKQVCIRDNIKIKENKAVDVENNCFDCGQCSTICPTNAITIKAYENQEDRIENYNPDVYTSKYLHRIITKNEKNRKLLDDESWANSNIFYRKYMSNPDSLFFVNIDNVIPSFEKASKLVKDSGGLVFIPHIYEYRDNSEKILKYILNNYNIDGIECYYTTFTKEQTEKLINICKERNLLMSGGSDYHGDFKPDVDMATGFGNLKIEDRIINNWKNDVTFI